MVVLLFASVPCALQGGWAPESMPMPQTESGDDAAMKSACVCSSHYAASFRSHASNQVLIPTPSAPALHRVDAYAALPVQPMPHFEDFVQSPDIPVPRLGISSIG